MRANQDIRPPIMRLAGFDIDAPPEVVMPLFLLGLLVVSALLSRLVRVATSRWLGGQSGPGGEQMTPPPKVAIPVAVAVVTGGLLLVLPEIPLPKSLSRW